jgi:hypothetical protein
MKKRFSFVLILSFLAVVSASAQTRTVTNNDLEKYRQKRVAAERDLRENYERLGFPSPAELERQIEQNRIERSELAARLRSETLERERLNLERWRAETDAQSRNVQIQIHNNLPRGDNGFVGYAPNGFFNYPYFGFPKYRYNNYGFGRGYRRGYGNEPRIEYRNNLPVLVQPPPRIILAPRINFGGRRN